LRHERFERGLPPSQNTSLATAAAAAAASGIKLNSLQKKIEDKPLIDFGDEKLPITDRLSNLRK
jgi:hypothetical protein